MPHPKRGSFPVLDTPLLHLHPVGGVDVRWCWWMAVRQRLQMLRRANHSLSALFLEGVPLSATCMLGARETKMLPGVHNTGKWGSVDSQPPLIEESTSRDSAKQRTTYAAEVRRGASGLMALEDLYNAGSFVASQMAFRSPSHLLKHRSLFPGQYRANPSLGQGAFFQWACPSTNCPPQQPSK